MIRHENVLWLLGGWVVSQSIESLTISMVEPAFFALLVSAVGFAPLLAAALLAAPITTVSVTSVARRADEEQRPALIGPTQPLSQLELASIGHRSCMSRRRTSTADSQYGKIPTLWWLAVSETRLPNNEPRLLITTGVHFFRRPQILPNLLPSIYRLQ